MNLFISRASDVTDPTRDPYDSASDLTPVLSAEMLLAPDATNPAVELPEINYNLDQTQALLIAFDIGLEGVVPETQAVPATEAVAYIGPPPPTGQPPIFEASFSDPDADRQPGYATSAHIFLVQRIAVR
jgi:hypothetical protein